MFTRLSIRNYVLIRELEIDFHAGLSIITGETGAGKSILLGALGLLTGQRADTGTLLDVSKKCIVEGAFDLSDELMKIWFDEHDLEYEPETIIRREITSDGKSRAFVNDSPVNLVVLKELGSQLIDIHSQHQNIYLQSPDFQLKILDTYAQQSDAVAAYHREFREYRKLQTEADELEKSAERDKSEAEYRQFLFDELDKAGLREGEEDELEEEAKALTHAEEIKAGLMQVNALLDAEEVSAIQMIKSAASVTGRIQHVYPHAESFFQRLESSLIELRDIAAETGQLAEKMEHNPEKLEEVNARIDLLHSLRLKHKVSTVKELSVMRDALSNKIAETADYDLRIENIRVQITQSGQRLTDMAKMISDKRRQAGADIEAGILSLLNRLGIPNAVFKAELIADEPFTPTGTDRVRFLFSANKQQNLQELGKVASGGEMSRLMLSIKAAIAEKIALPTLIFDEIDAGISGETAEKMGNILEEMSQFAQIINITHLPQVAAKGLHHYKVHKEDSDDATHTKVRKLTPEERVTEIAKMLSGEKITDAAIENAKHLLGKR